jgi:hypothetical protein
VKMLLPVAANWQTRYGGGGISVESKPGIPFLFLTAQTQTAVHALGSCKLRDSESRPYEFLV